MDSSELTLADIRKMHPRERRGLFEDLVTGHGPLLLRRAFSILRDEQLAQDICQEAWLVLHQHLSPSLATSLLNGSPPVGPVALWLEGVVRNLALKERRKVQTRRQATTSAAAVPPQEPEDPHVHSQELTLDFQAALRHLTSKQRQVFLLRFDEMLPFETIAAKLDISSRAARKRYLDARDRLRELLSDWNS